MCDIPWMRAARCMLQIGIAWKAFTVLATSMNIVLPFLRASAMTDTTADVPCEAVDPPKLPSPKFRGAHPL